MWQKFFPCLLMGKLLKELFGSILSDTCFPKGCLIYKGVRTIYGRKVLEIILYLKKDILFGCEV